MTESSEAYELSAVVATSLALVLAAEAKRCDVVTQIATELERRRPSALASEVDPDFWTTR